MKGKNMETTKSIQIYKNNTPSVKRVTVLEIFPDMKKQMSELEFRKVFETESGMDYTGNLVNVFI